MSATHLAMWDMLVVHIQSVASLMMIKGNGRTGSYAHMEGPTKTVIPSTWVYKPHCTEPGLSWIITTGNGPCPMKEKQSNCFTVPSSPNKNVYKEKGKIQQTSKR